MNFMKWDKVPECHIDIKIEITPISTSVSERLPPQNLPYDGCPHSLDLSGAGLEYKRVL